MSEGPTSVDCLLQLVHIKTMIMLGLIATVDQWRQRINSIESHSLKALPESRYSGVGAGAVAKRGICCHRVSVCLFVTSR